MTVVLPRLEVLFCLIRSYLANFKAVSPGGGVMEKRGLLSR